jgi:two-component system phosphate regulon sensor histidine kinase PhoR
MLFFKTKKPSPEQLAWFVAINNSAILFLVTLGSKLLFFNSITWTLVFAIPLVALVFIYLAAYDALKRFIYQKIKLIYKTIHSMKTPTASRPIKVNMKNHMIDEIEQEVVEWAANWNKEISALQNMEVYRREFIGNVSHELKTPIFNIQGYIHTLLDGALEDPDINEKYLQRAANNAERMANIVADLGYISKFEAGKLQLVITCFDICKLIKDVLDDAELNAREKSIKLTFKNPEQKPLMVEADIESIRRVVVNLISNSIKYGKKGGKTLIGFYDLDSNILIEVADDGKGIEQEHLPRLFERFYRVDKGRSRTEGGTGLGLAIVKHILEAHHQTITARSRIEVGSTLGFTLKKAQ